MDEFFVFIGNFVMVTLFVILVAMLMAFPTMWLWNWLMPELFGLKAIGLFQAMGINMLCGILFKSSNNRKED